MSVVVGLKKKKNFWLGVSSKDSKIHSFTYIFFSNKSTVTYIAVVYSAVFIDFLFASHEAEKNIYVDI